MAYIIPNATETGSGQKYANINQAEPDSVDIEALGNRPNWVRSGCAVSIVSEQVLTTAGVVVIGNVPYSVNAVTSGISIPRATIGARTDLVVARKSGSTVSVQVVTGIDTATNPIFPRSKTIVGNLFNSASNYDPDNDVLLASIYVTSAETDENNNVDKRIVSAEPVIRYSSSAAAPTSTGIDVIGDVVVASNGIVYVKTGASAWEAIATRSYSDSTGFPIGSLFVWAGNQSPGPNYLACNGQEVLQSSYPVLFAAIGNLYGTSTAGNFRLPNLNSGRVPTGTTNTANIGQNTGNNANQVTLSTANLPAHKHITGTSLGHDGTSHSTLGAAPTTEGELGSGHRHKGHIHGHQGAMMFRPYDSHNDHHVISATNHGTSAFHVDVYRVNETDPVNPFSTTDTTDTNEENATPGTALGAASRFDDSSQQNKLGNFTQTDFPSTKHIHNITLDSHSITPHTITEEMIGNGAAVNITPMGVFMRWYIRAL